MQSSIGAGILEQVEFLKVRLLKTEEHRATLFEALDELAAIIAARRTIDLETFERILQPVEFAKANGPSVRDRPWFLVSVRRATASAPTLPPTPPPN